MTKRQSTVKEITAYMFAGVYYESREEAERAEAILDLKEFFAAQLDKEIGMASLDSEQQQGLFKVLERDFEKIIGLLNRLY